MLVEFRVKNFKNFKEELILKLDNTKNYEFNSKAIKKGLVNTAIVYGKNASGKSNLGVAILDISANITDKEKGIRNIGRPFVNLESNENATFFYKFKINDSYLIYEYEKDNDQNLVKEELFIDCKKYVYFDHRKNVGSIEFQGAETLKTDLSKVNLAFVKYIRSNAILKDNETNRVFNKFIDFVDNMLMFSSLQRNHYQGFKIGRDNITSGILKKNKVKEFQEFLEIAGIKYNLIEKDINEEKKLYCQFGKKEVDFFSVASTGTITLTLFYYWLMELRKVSFVFIDEFDAFYHNELARYVVKKVIEKKAQAIFTTHNTSIMTNDILRPDCLFNIVDNKILSFANLTNKELRKAHNIEKMYKAGFFDGE